VWFDWDTNQLTKWNTCYLFDLNATACANRHTLRSETVELSFRGRVFKGDRVTEIHVP